MMKQLRSSNFLTLIMSMLVTTVGIPMNAMAQGGAVLEEVVVTARQRTEKLTDVPASITAFTEGTIDRAGVERAEDFIALTPGVSMVNTAESGDTSLSIRGINGARDAETNFAFIIDGILYTNPSAFNREYSDLKQIEVLKGPQGALYGRSASAGAVIVTTGKPSNETEGSIEASYASHETVTVKAMMSGALKEDELYGRFSVDYRDTDGQFRNGISGDRSVTRFENYNVNGRLLWEPSEDLSIDGKIRYGEIDAASISFNAAFSLPPFTGFLGPDADIDVNEHDFVFTPNVAPLNEQETIEASIKVDYDMDWGSVTAWALYSETEQFFMADGTSGAFGFYNGQQSCIDSFVANTGALVQSPTFVGPDAASSLLPPYSPTTCDGYQYQERNQEDISFEIRVSSSADQQLRWNAGVFFLDIEREVGVAQGFDDGGPITLGFGAPNIDALVNDRFDSKVYSIFGAVNYDMTPEIEASFALRWDREERKVSNLVPTPSTRTSTRIDYCAGLNGGAGCTLNGTPLVGTPLNPAFVSDFATGTVIDSIDNISKNFSQIQPKVSLTWDVTDSTTLFGSWGIGFKSGGFNNVGSSSTIQNFLVAGGAALVAPSDIYQKETTSAFEVGFKSQFADGRVNVSGAAFYTEIDDMQFFEFFVGPFGLLRVVENVDEAETWGFELGVAAQLTDRLTFNAGWSLIEGKIKKNSIRTNTVGNDIPNAPEYTFNTSAQYIAPAFEGVDFVGYINYSRLGKTWFHTVQQNVVPATLFGGPPADFKKTRRDAYGVINLRAGLEGDNWKISGFVQNLLDEKFLAEVITAPEFGGSFVHPGTDRVYGVEVGYSFF
jgi:iron complex outermembrane recepter protein